MWTIHRPALLCVFLSTAVCGPIEAAPPAERLLPDSTTGFLSIADPERLEQHWQTSQLGRLVEDEAMQPFVEDLKGHLKQRETALKEQTGLTVADLKGVASGEVALALVRAPDATPYLGVLAGVAGREQEVAELLRKLDAGLAARGARKGSELLGKTRLTLYKLPPEETRVGEGSVVVFVRDDLLCVTSGRELAEDILARFAEGAQARLADLAAYRAIMQRCAASAGELAPEVRWFIEPFGFTYAYRELQVKKPRRRRRRNDVAEVLQRHGFDAIKGVGGYVNLDAESGVELVHRTFVYAPTDRGATSDLAMRLLRFPAAGDLLPQPWVPQDVATYASFNWDIQAAFDHVGPLADDLVLRGPGDFETMLEGIARGEHGPKVDIRKEIVAHLGQRITAITEYELPITPKSERFLFAIESTNDEALADAIRRLMETDKWRRRRDFQGHVLWETVPDPIDDPVQLTIEDEFEIVPFDSRKRDEAKIEARKPQFPQSAVGVADGQLWIASHIEYLKDILSGIPSEEQLTSAVDYARVKSTMSALAPESLSVRSFSRTEKEYRPTFELLRQGMMPQSETLLGRVLNEMLTEENPVRQQKWDAGKLPPFEEVEQYFGPAGLIVSAEKDGWFIVGAMLSSDGPDLARKPQE